MNVLEINLNNAAGEISGIWDRWDTARTEKKKEWEELRNYVYATDTTKTTNSRLPWKNKTTIPKLTQIMENLLANYEASLFPNEDWIEWQAGETSSSSAEKRKVITSFMKNKLIASNFRTTIRDILLDWVLYGNCFATLEYVSEINTDKSTGEKVKGFVGAKLVRISPYDIVFNPTASSFEQSPKIVRSIKSIGELALDIRNKPEHGYKQEIYEKLVQNRRMFQSLGKRAQNEVRKAFLIDGFGSIDEYYTSGYVELLEFVGDVFDTSTGELYENYYITVADRKEVIRFEPIGTWNGQDYIKHISWRPRTDNLWGMSPLDNLVGMQYRIDHLENLKADIMDMVAFPVTVLKGDVEWEGWMPNSEAYVGEDGSIDLLRVDSQALQYDSQIAGLEMKMEQMAGAPREAMGIRSAGEKTAYEVQQLQNAASRLFQYKITYFEEVFLEPLVNQMFEISRRNLDGYDTVRMFDDEFGFEAFVSITKDDISGSGHLYPRGARHFAERARFIQEVTQFLSTLGSDPSIRNHISGKAIAKTFAEHFNLDKIGAYQENINLLEQFETQRLMSQLQQQIGVESATPTEAF